MDMNFPTIGIACVTYRLPSTALPLDELHVRGSLRSAPDMQARRGGMDLPYDHSDVLTHLTNFMCSELLAARFFLGLSRRTREPVLKTLLSLKEALRNAAR